MHAQPIEFFVALETQVWEALRRGDAEADRALLAPEFLGVYETGFADRAMHADQLSGGPTVAEYTIVDPQLLTLSATSAMLCYRADYRREAGPQESMYISSLWAERDGTWLNVFSQDTPTPAPDAKPSP